MTRNVTWAVRSTNNETGNSVVCSRCHWTREAAEVIRSRLEREEQGRTTNRPVLVFTIEEEPRMPPTPEDIAEAQADGLDSRYVKDHPEQFA